MRTKVVHITDDHDVDITRNGCWGNPFTHIKDRLHRAEFTVEARQDSIESFKLWLVHSDDPRAQWMRDNIKSLRGKRLGCHCRSKKDPKPCHGDVLAAAADGTLITHEELTLF